MLMAKIHAQILTGYKSMGDAQWESVMVHLPEVVRLRLRERYGV
jgi:hypothetical protein